DGQQGGSLWWQSRELAHAEPALAPFKRGDKVEHVDNAPGFIMTAAADQYTSGAVLVEHPDGTRRDHQAKYLKHTDTIIGDDGKPMHSPFIGETKTRAKTLREAGKLIDGD